jgi:hypothetical protein
MLTINTVCEKMLLQGFEYGCMANDTSLEFISSYHPQKMTNSILKPCAPALHRSRINEWVDGDQTTETVLEWYNFVTTQDFRVSTYATRPLVFVKADMSKIAQVNDNRFKSEWQKTIATMPVVRWTDVGNVFAGIRVHPAECYKHKVNDLFPMWDVDTLVSTRVSKPSILLSRYVALLHCWFANPILQIS